MGGEVLFGWLSGVCVFVLVDFFVCFLGTRTWECSLWIGVIPALQ